MLRQTVKQIFKETCHLQTQWKDAIRHKLTNHKASMQADSVSDCMKSLYENEAAKK